MINSGTDRLVDLSQLEYVSSSGLPVFLIVAKRLECTQVKMVLCPLKDHIRQVSIWPVLVHSFHLWIPRRGDQKRLIPPTE